MPVKGVKEVQQNMRRIFKDISDKKAPQFVSAVMSIGLNHSKELTPIAFSNLINSSFTDMVTTATGTIGTVGYTAKYAVYLNGTDTYTPLWKPVPLPKYEVKGGRSNDLRVITQSRPGAPATNMDAKPRFLNRGFEDSESQALIKRAEDIFKA